MHVRTLKEIDAAAKSSATTTCSSASSVESANPSQDEVRSSRLYTTQTNDFDRPFVFQAGDFR